MGVLVRLLAKGIGFTSEAIHAARSKNDNDRSVGASSSSSAYASANASQAPPQYVEVPDELTASELVRTGRAERVYPDEKKRNPLSEKGKYDQDEGEYDDSTSDSDADSELGQDEAVWALDEAVERVPPPSYEQSEEFMAAGAGAGDASQSEEAQAKKREMLVRDLVRMAGPPSVPLQKLPCPVIVPQRRPRNKERGFVRAYAPVLEQCGISQDLFLKFLDDWAVASKVSDSAISLISHLT
jgi:hypothetical protein